VRVGSKGGVEGEEERRVTERWGRVRERREAADKPTGPDPTTRIDIKE